MCKGNFRERRCFRRSSHVDISNLAKRAGGAVVHGRQKHCYGGDTALVYNGRPSERIEELYRLGLKPFALGNEEDEVELRRG